MEVVYEQILGLTPFPYPIVDMVWEYYAHLGWWESWFQTMLNLYGSEKVKKHKLNEKLEIQFTYEKDCKKIDPCPFRNVPETWMKKYEHQEYVYDDCILRVMQSGHCMYIYLPSGTWFRHFICWNDHEDRKNCDFSFFPQNPKKHEPIYLHTLHYLTKTELVRQDFGPFHFNGDIPTLLKKYPSKISMPANSLPSASILLCRDWFYQVIDENGQHGVTVFGVLKSHTFSKRLLSVLKLHHTFITVPYMSTKKRSNGMPFYSSPLPFLEDDLHQRLGL